MATPSRALAWRKAGGHKCFMRNQVTAADARPGGRPWRPAHATRRPRMCRLGALTSAHAIPCGPARPSAETARTRPAVARRRQRPGDSPVPQRRLRDRRPAVGADAPRRRPECPSVGSCGKGRRRRWLRGNPNCPIIYIQQIG
ncbi:hypothetical protein GUJ93_ZPchr0008g11627 [Zizania palustris]|uniref:Uncharacterized protein n=1 Tax=Zizania palustris TaxID=103762 RepID=A0A8J5RPP2_ZIZPA|nr:hypothetical protein GUJ93_ZPchr0008g11627 [Zizania palustris]